MVLLMIAVTGCSKIDVIERNYSYKGENEYWDAEFNVKGTVTFEKKAVSWIQKVNQTMY